MPFSQSASFAFITALAASATGTACTSTQDDSDGTPADSPVDSGPADDTAPPSAACASGMVGVPADHPVYCIDAYEVVVTDGIAAAIAGALPTENISYDDAVAACAATPVLDGSGAQIGFKHMATSQEWEDAGDGVPGEGGTTFPYGDEWVDGACAALDLDGTQQYTAVQPAGSFPDCVSDFGTYDQVGNLHEWMDPDLTINAAAALARFAKLGVTVAVGTDGGLYGEGSLNRLILQVIAALPGNVASQGGRLYVAANEVNWLGEAEGYLAGSTDAPDLGWYPVQLVPMDDGTGYWINPMPESDGLPIPDKRGCAYYAGVGGGCDLHHVQYVHTHEFKGTIGFRCASGPI